MAIAMKMAAREFRHMLDPVICIADTFPKIAAERRA
jgi:hypothetical protein